jgi:heat shock protein HtpX
VQMAISRAREFGADEGAREIIGSPMPLVNALRKLDAASKAIPMDTSPAMAHLFIVNPFGGKKGGGGFASLFMTHPPIEKRIERLMGR